MITTTPALNYELTISRANDHVPLSAGTPELLHTTIYEIGQLVQRLEDSYKAAGRNIDIEIRHTITTVCHDDTNPF